ncbi:hypothetical protein GGR50DRAFT_686927 [Xylaria sp. CBS 124048]|nr:hypothetical protein GGR50DRAFT_686927 [Xylaria sp. CBS 124048]
MPSFERELPSDRHVRHQHSASSGALVPMWDSSDPDRAPPPLPLNPQSPPSVSPSRSGTSLAIQSAHAALTEKARESNFVPSIHKRNTDISPERGLVQRGPHKRMQSLQTGSVRDLSLMIEAGRDSTGPTPRGSPEKERYAQRPSTPVRMREPDKEVRPNEREISIHSLPPQVPSNMTPAMRNSVRWSQQSILGENTPPQSATMLALHNNRSPPPARETESPLATVTNNAAAQPNPATSNEQLSNQLVALTNIATALQREMSALSRRSRDNATDLMSLKEATHARDEDIRKSLRDLVTNVDLVKHHRDAYSGGPYLDNRAFNNTSPVSKTSRGYLPRIPSPNSFAASIDRESVLSTPSLVGAETPATMALLEKIIREMGTKDGQDTIFDRLGELAQRLNGMASANKVEELLDYLKSMRDDRALMAPPSETSKAMRSLSFDSTSETSTREVEWEQHSTSSGQKAERLMIEKDGRESPTHTSSNSNEAVLNDEILKIIHSVKDSVAQGGGLTAEVKALVRELRGEVLGMGRELGRKLEESGGRSSHSKSESSSREELARIVEESLEQMKLYMQQRLREHRRESTDSTKSGIDYQEIYSAMRSAISDAQESHPQEPQLSRDDVLNAVKDAWEKYKPEIEIQQLGLERDEVLACIKDGLREEVAHAATREEVFAAVVEGLKNFTPPQIDTPETLSRDEVLEAVRECLEEFEFPVASNGTGNDLTREDMLMAVKQGLDEFDFPDPTTALVPHAGGNAEILDRLHQIMEYMHTEFKLQHIIQYLQTEFKTVSEDARHNIAANEQNTEHVLDATRDGLETLRAHIEEYVDRIIENNGLTAQEELMANLVSSFDSFRNELSEMMAKASDNSRDLVKQEIVSLRDTVNSSLVPHVPPPTDNREVFEAIRESLNQVRSDLLRPHAGTTDILDALHEGFSDMRAFLERITDKPVDLTANDEILDALRSGLDDVRSDIDGLRGSNDDERALTTFKPGSKDLMLLNDLVKHDDIKSLEVTLHDDFKDLQHVVAQLQSRLESMNTEDASQKPFSKEDLAEIEEMLQKAVSKEDLKDIREVLGKVVSKEDLIELEETLRNMQQSVAGVMATTAKDGESPAGSDTAATKEDVQAIETILRNTKSRLDDLIDGEQAVRKDDVDAVQALVLETKDSFGAFSSQLETITRKEDLTAIEGLVTQITVVLGEMKEQAEKAFENSDKVTKADVEELEATISEIKSVVEKMSNDDLEDLKAVENAVREIQEHNSSVLPSKEDLKAVSEEVVKEIKDHHTAVFPSKEDLKTVEEIVREIKEYNVAQEEANTSALASRQAEVASVHERVGEIQAFLESFQAMTKERFAAGGNGVETLGRMLESLGEALNHNVNLGSDLKQFFEAMKTEFDDFKGGVVGAKIDTDEKLKEVADAIQEKMNEKIGELVTKYDDFLLVINDKSKTEEARATEMEAAFGSNKAIVQELKGLIGTLGTTVTDSFEKMEEASKTVFERVEENHADGKGEHEKTREQVKQATDVIEGLQGQVSEYQPQILEAVKDVLLVAGQHFEHSKSSVTDIQRYIDNAKPELPEKYNDTVVQTKLDNLNNLNTGVHYKLDKLVDHTQAANRAYAQLDTLEKVHQQVVQTAADITEFLSSQKQRIEDEHEEREKALQETTLALERQRAEQEHVIVTLVSLKDEETQLRESVLALKAEQEALTRQKTRLTADVSSLETALHLRREELHVMDTRAEMLERRILEGVLDHSRALLMTKSSAKGREAMSRKRVAHSSLGVDGSKSSSRSTTAVNMAVKNNRASLISPNSPNRRILSLSQINNNLPAAGVKRSQSVRTPTAGAFRKNSWVPAGDSGTRKGYGELVDKENVDSMRESDEEQEEAEGEGEGEGDNAPTPVVVPVDIPEEDETVTYAEEYENELEHEHEHEHENERHDDENYEQHDEDKYERHHEEEEEDLDMDMQSEVGTTVITGSRTGAYSNSDPGSDYEGSPGLDDHDHDHDHGHGHAVATEAD